MKKTFIFLLVVFCYNNFSAQSRIEKKADHYYDHYSYTLAYKHYQFVKEKSTSVMRKMAFCQQFLENIPLADTLWRKVCASSDANGEDYYQYAQVLKMSGRWEESEKFLKKAQSTLNEEAKANKSFQAYEELKNLQKDNGQYVINALTINTADQDFAPYLLDSTLMFSSSRDGVFPLRNKWNGNGKPFLDLFEGKINRQDQVETVKRRTKSWRGKFHDGPVAFNSKGDYAVVTRNNGNRKNKELLGQLELFDSRLVEGVWSDLKQVELKGFEECSVGHASISKDGNTMYFVSDKKGGAGGTDVYRVTKSADGSWGLPENMGTSINSEGNELFPFAYQDDLLLFSSNGLPGIGGLDIFVAKLDNGKVRKVINAGASLNSNGDDFSIFLKSNEMKGYFSSNRSGGRGSDDIYKVTVLTPWVFDKAINILVKNTKGEPLVNAEVLVRNEKGEVIETLKTDNKGEAHALSTHWELSQLECNFPEYESAVKSFDARSVDNEGWVELVAERIPRFKIVGNVLDLKSSKGLEQVKVDFENKYSNNRSLLYTDQNGQFGLDVEKGPRIGDKIKVSISCTKKGYLPLEETFTVSLDKEGEVNINSFMDLRLEKIEVGKDLGKMLDVKPIYFDLGKSDIRPDAAAELDKIVAAMNENPTIEIELGSHTDCRGSKASNAKLSDARAKASAEYVQSRITNPKRIFGKGYGESKLVNGCACEGKKPSTCTEEEHQANRRTEFKIIKI